ncbi:MAG: hypothetical protein KC486_23955, partial [Myxococcales bacterium]|nr:hypothetical protein [Myxococcales bacterium]
AKKATAKKRAAKKTARGRQAGGRVEPVAAAIRVERVQTGVRIEKRILKVLKGLAELYEISLGDLIEGIVLHAFDGRSPFGAEAIARIDALKQIYGLELDASASHRLVEE